MTLCVAAREFKQGQQLYQKAQDNEFYDVYCLDDALDSFTRAIKLAFEVDVETEAIASAHLAKTFYKGYKNVEKAKHHYRNCIRLLETLKPKTYTDEKWHKLMMKHMKEIEQKEAEEEAA